MGWKAYDSNGSQLQMALTDLPVGTIVGTGRSSAPNNWLLCDGGAYSRTGYAELFGAIGTDYGVGNGSTTFNVPSVDGHMILASSNSSRFGINDGSYLPDNVISTSKLVDSAVTTAKLNDSSVTTAKVAANAITSAKIANNAIGGSQLASGAKNIVSTTKTDTYVMTSTTFTDVTGLSVTITPTASSSKILIVGYLSGMGAAAQTNFFARLTRGGTAICVGDAAGSRIPCTIHAHDNNAGHAFGFNYLDSPNTTSATTYAIQIRSQTGGYGVTVNRTGPDGDGVDVGRTASTITAIEVLA